MGITGLLPALKSISTQRHLSEFADQTLGVDAYVWLHRGVFTCATELATGKATTKYVDYAMHRVRLLRHHKIEPYIVFDGGPLPAKKGTEVDRQARRAEHLALGNALAAQGKTSQAREHYVKCIDVTPQMAFQFIKALRAEGVKYVVAPYEADAQLAYLERTGAVDGVITEDSDLLVFGCRVTLYKLDAVSSTAMCIDRADFARVGADGISLHGWSDTQFRAMAILSGCDYLPSIPGIGLKTACTLLRKWKTVEQVVRAIAMEGKKSMPRDYLRSFRLAEKCFLHQRVYDPYRQKLVHLSEPDADWDEDADAYVGGDLEPEVAKKLAEGDVDPVTLLPMTDICPRYVPRVLKAIPLVNGIGGSTRGKGKGKAVSLLSFFGPAPKPKSPSSVKIASPKAAKPGMIAGKASGKRSLADEMDRDNAAKRKKRQEGATPPTTQSRFFASPSRVEIDVAIAGPSHFDETKENVPPADANEYNDLVETDLDADLEWDSLSLVVMPGQEDEMQMVDIAEPDVGVEQEDGYISPTPSRSKDAEDFSSPLRHSVTPPPRQRPKSNRTAYSPGPEVDAVSSPPDAARVQLFRLPALPLYRSNSGEVLVPTSPDPPRTVLVGPDLFDAFDDERTSDIDCFEEDVTVESATPTPSPPTPDVGLSGDATLALADPEELEAKAYETRAAAVATGWRERWMLTSDKARTTPTLRRRETTVTPAGHHFPINSHLPHPYTHHTPSSVPSKNVGAKTTSLQSRRSLTFLDPGRSKPVKRRTSDLLLAVEDRDEAVANAQIRLAQFRCPP
ncbi:exodeoxyribonuclease 1 [Mycena pura]|uniref:Exodeoxyribonuclease 1 n=1 Tax=Mycena pura TaxID=153505 RepID=A0AAD6UWJ2_9AGAR|nr:exodeoxyribonuclease 1 [Mycena pura]